MITIKFCIKLKKTVTETKEMLDAAYKSAMSQSRVYCWYNEFTSGRKRVELTDRPVATTTVLMEKTINTGTIMILDNLHLTVRQFASLLDISIRNAHTLLLTELDTLVSVCSVDSMFTLTTTKRPSG